MAEDIQPVKALYYPRILSRSLGWLKAALLYWEGLVRVVPDDFEPLDPPGVHDLVEAGLIESISPDRYLEGAQRTFAASLEKLLQGRSRSSRRADRGSGALLHVRELAPSLLQELQTRGLAMTAGEWVSMAGDVAALYKICLTGQAGRELHAAPAIDEGEGDVAAWFFSSREQRGGSAATGLVDGFACARRVHPFPEIEQNGVPTNRLLAARRTFAPQRRAFREQLQGRVAAIDTLPSVAAVRAHLDDAVSEIDGEVNAQRRDLGTVNARNALKVVTMSTPAALGTAVTLAGAPIPTAVAGVTASLGLGVVDWFLQRRQLGRFSTSYVLLLEAALARSWRK
jgi:hypothetical protein